MSWYYNRATGDIAEETGLNKFGVDREIDLEKLNPLVPQIWFGPFASQASAEDFKAHNPSFADAAKAIPGEAQHAVGAVVPDVASALAGFGNQLVKLSIRIAEIAVGVVLLAIAANVILKQVTGVDVAGKAIAGGKKAAKAGATAAVVA